MSANWDVSGCMPWGGLCRLLGVGRHVLYQQYALARAKVLLSYDSDSNKKHWQPMEMESRNTTSSIPSAKVDGLIITSSMTHRL